MARGGVDPNDQLDDNGNYPHSSQGLHAWVSSQGRNVSVSFTNLPRNWNQWFGPQVTGLLDNDYSVSAARTRCEVSPIPLDGGGWAVAWYGTKWCVECFHIELCANVEL